MSEVIKQDLKTEALKLALDWYDSGNENPDDFANMIKQVIALAQQQAQGCDYCNHPQYAGIKCKNCGREQSAQDQGQSCYCPNCEALSKELAALKAQQEPMAWMKDCADFWEHYTYISEASQENYKAEAQMWVEKLRTSPPASKPWVGLTDEEELKLAQDSMGKSRHWLVAQVGTKLREKNA